MTAKRKNEEGEPIALGTRAITITHPDRVLFPDDGFTKADLCHYYRDVAHWLLPYTEDRPLTLQRFPKGIKEFSFFEKEAPRGMPEWIARTAQPSTGKRALTTYPLCNDAPSLLWFANLGSITLHTWMSRLPTIDSPDFLLLDLDPFTGCTLRTLAHVALRAREELEAIGLVPSVKTTGGKGLHVVVPLATGATYDDTRALTETLARRIHRACPDLTTVERSKAKRPDGVVYLDWGQLGLGKTLVPPYVVRARPGAPVSVPLDWAEVEALATKRTKRPTDEAFRQWNITNVPALLAERGDLWKKPFRKRQRLDAALEKARSTK